MADVSPASPGEIGAAGSVGAEDLGGVQTHHNLA